MKKWLYLLGLLTVIFSLLAIETTSQNNKLETQLQNQYTQQLAVASEHITTLHTALLQATVLKDEKALNEQLLQVHESSGQVKQALAAIPVLNEETNSWIRYMTDIQSFAANTIKDGTQEKWHDQSQTLAQQFTELDDEWAILTANYFQHQAGLMDYTESTGGFDQLSNNIKSFSEQSFPVTASESDYEKKKNLEHITEAPITKQQAQERFFTLFPELKDATLTISLNKDDAPYEFYHIQFVRGSRIGYVDILKNGGELISMLVDRPIQEQQISQEQAREHAEKFLKHLNIKDVKFVEVRENHEVWHFVFSRLVDNVLVYPDTIQIKVAKDKPEVLGINALEYIQKEEVETADIIPIDWETILTPNAKVQESRLVLIEGLHYEPTICVEAIVTSEIDDYHTYRMYVNAKTAAIEKMELVN
jgi:spore germination protein